MEIATSQFGLKDRIFLITGAASGIGKATALTLSKLGAKLILLDINGEALNEVKSHCNEDDLALEIDLTDFSSLKTHIFNLVAKLGKLNGIIHCAGRPYISPLKAISIDKCKDILDLNTFAALELSKIFINRNVYAGESGSIVFISSVYGSVGSAANVGYAMSKSALHGIAKALAIELAPRDIRVNCVAPGFVRTQMLEDTNNMFEDNRNNELEKLHPIGMGEPQDVANAVAFLLSDASKWITGIILPVDGGYTAQ